MNEQEPTNAELRAALIRLRAENDELRKALATIRKWHKGNGVAEGFIDKALATKEG